MPKPKRKCIFQPFIFMGCGYISFRKVRFLEYQSQDFFQRKTWCLRLCGSRVFFFGFGVNSSYLAHMGVSKNKGTTKLIMNFHRVWNHDFHHAFWGFSPYFWVDTHMKLKPLNDFFLQVVFCMSDTKMR